MLKSISIMLNLLNENDIKYCHWKSNEHLEEALNGDTDLDMLFLPEERTKLEKILCEAGLKRFRATSLMQYNAIEDFVGFDYDESKIWHLHLHYRLTFGEKNLKGYTTTFGRKMINNRNFLSDKKIYISNSNDEMLLLIIRMSLKIRWRDMFSKVGEDDLKEISWLKNKINKEDVRIKAKELFNLDISNDVINLIENKIKHKRQLFKLQRKLRNKLRNYTGYSMVSSFIVREVREIAWLIGAVNRRLGLNSTKTDRRVSPSGGSLIVFLGCDGAGKSTTISYVYKELIKKVDVYKVYMGSGDGDCSLLRLPMKLVANRISGKGLSSKYSKNIQKSKKSIKSFFYGTSKILWALALAREKKIKCKKITKAKNRGIIVLSDRFPQTNIVGYNDGPLLSNYKNSKNILFKNLANWEEKIYSDCFKNTPDLVIKMTVDENIALQRKPEMNIEEIKDKKEAVNLIDLGCKEVEIDTSVIPNNAVGDALKSIWGII